MAEMTRGTVSQSQLGNGNGIPNASAKSNRFTPSQAKKASAMTEVATRIAGSTALTTAMIAFHISLWKNPILGERKLLNSRRCRTSSGSRVISICRMLVPRCEVGIASGNSFPQRARQADHHAPTYPPPETVDK